jgi:hypothetical protein
MGGPEARPTAEDFPSAAWASAPRPQTIENNLENKRIAEGSLRCRRLGPPVPSDPPAGQETFLHVRSSLCLGAFPCLLLAAARQESGSVFNPFQPDAQ